MEFLPHSSLPQPKNLIPCLATITVTTHSNDPKLNRRLSTGSFGSDADDNTLKRVISGGRRKSSFGHVAGAGEAATERRKSFGLVGGAGAGGGGTEEGHGVDGKWYWRVQAGVTDTHLILLPLTEPANPLLTTPPAPLSRAMPSHSAHASAGTRTEPGGGTGDNEEDTGLVGKMKHLFRRTSTSHGIPKDKDTLSSKRTADSTDTSTASATGTGDNTNTGTTAFTSERVVDQTAQGEMLPSAKGNAIGATNLNSSAVLGWPGVLHGDKLGAVVVSLGSVDKSKVTLGGGKKGEASWVTVPITSYFSQFVHPMIDSVGSNKHESYPNSGSIKFEFDKDWIGAKGEAEVLHHSITQAITSLPAAGERATPEAGNFKLGSRNRAPVPEQAVDEADEGEGPLGDSGAHGQAQQGSRRALELGQEESFGSSRSGKVGGD